MKYNTEKKTQVVELLSAMGEGEFTIDEIVATLSQDGGGRSTYYRIISQMVKDGTVKKITDEHSRHTTYQYLGTGGCAEHMHLKCKECGRLIHLDHETSHLLEEKIKSVGGFAVDEGALLFGRCEGCIKGGTDR